MPAMRALMLFGLYRLAAFMSKTVIFEREFEAVSTDPIDTCHRCGGAPRNRYSCASNSVLRSVRRLDID